MEDEMSTFCVYMLINFEISMIIVYDDQLLGLMSNQHTELYKQMILAQYLYFLQQNQYFSVLTLNTLQIFIASQAFYMCITL